MLHSNTSTVTYLEAGSSPVVRTTLDLHIVHTYALWNIFCGVPKGRGLC